MMTSGRGLSSGVGFHAGELAVQRRAGVEGAAARLAGMLAPAELRTGIARFVAGRTFATLTARDDDGRLWISPLTGSAGFLDVTAPTTLTVHAAPVPGDPLRDLPAGQSAGLLVIDFATRRRVRINGTLAAAESTGLRIDVEQAYGNCPQYIQPRLLAPGAVGTHEGTVRRSDSLDPSDTGLVTSSDTFFIGTTHPTRGADASHRGGPAGFVRVERGTLWWPDYSGNSMFNTLGNLVVDPAAALLFADFATGDTLHLSGTAVTEWTALGVAEEDDATGRRVRFTPQAVLAGQLLPVHAVMAGPSRSQGFPA